MIKVAVVGCGYWGKNLIHNFSQLGALGAVCDTHSASAVALSASYGVAHKTFEDILEDSALAGVVIAAPVKDHAALGVRALRSGKHVFVEKPLALTVEEGEYLCQTAEAFDRILMVGHVLQYHPAFVTLKEMLHSGTWGKLLYISSHRLSLGKFRAEENVIWSFATHDLSMLLALTQKQPTTVESFSVSHLRPGIIDIATLNFSFPEGTKAQIMTSWLHPYKEQKLTVICENGMAVFEDTAPWSEKLKIFSQPVRWVEGMPQPQKMDPYFVQLSEEKPLELECKHFLDCIQNGKKPRTDGQEGLSVLKILEQTY